MKKTFTLVTATLLAFSANAQEIWSVADHVTDLETQEQTIKATDHVTVKIASFLNEKDKQDEAKAWELSGDATTNTALNTADCDTKFTSFLKGKGNPYVLDNGGYWEETDKGQAFRDDPDAQKWTEGCGKLPVHGMFTAFTTKAAGTMKVGIYTNKGNHPTYIVDGTSKKHLAADKIKVSFYYQNNGFTFKDNGIDVGFVKGTMPADFIVQHTNGYTQNRTTLGYVEFPAEANKTYYIFCPDSQVGLYGFKFTTSTAGINDITVETAANATVYNLAGQKVGKDYKGVVIKNGKKYIQK